MSRSTESRTTDSFLRQTSDWIRTKDGTCLHGYSDPVYACPYGCGRGTTEEYQRATKTVDE